MTNAATRLHEKWENYSGNNPNRFRAGIETAKATLARIEGALKNTGVLPRTTQEERDAALDRAYPNALTLQIVQWEGQRCSEALHARDHQPLREDRTRVERL